jgi:hypothetical protein
MRTTAPAAHPANFKQGPALKRGTGLTCTVFLSLTIPGTPLRDKRKGFARAVNKALIYNISNDNGQTAGRWRLTLQPSAIAILGSRFWQCGNLAPITMNHLEWRDAAV